MADNLVDFDSFAGGAASPAASSSSGSGKGRSPANPDTLPPETPEELQFRQARNMSEWQKSYKSAKDPKQRSILEQELQNGDGTDFPTGSSTQLPKGAGSDTMSFEDFTGSSPTQPSPYERVFSTTLQGLRAVGGEAAALADLVLSAPGFVLQTGAQLGGTVQAAARGVPLSPGRGLINPDLPEPTDQVERRYLRPIGVGQGTGTVTAYSVGREAGQNFGEPFMNPVKKVLDMFKSGEAYDQAKTTQGMAKVTSAMKKAGVWAEKNWGISRDAVPMLGDVLMISVAGIGAKTPHETAIAELQARTRKLASDMKAQAEVERKAETLSPEEFAARVPVQQQINDMLAIRSPAEQARVERQRRADIKSAFRQPAEGSDYGSIEESQFRADERMRNSEAQSALSQRLAAEENARHTLDTEALPPRPERIGQAEILRILQKPGYERSAEDLLTLREARKQGGKMDPTVAALLASAGVGATIGATLDDDHLRGAFLGAATAGMPLAMLKSLGAGNVASRFGQAGAVKGPGGMWHPEAVQRLTEPLANSVTRGYEREVLEAAGAGKFEDLKPADVENAKTLLNWSPKAIRNYLNKYAGTERDPLKDVEIPFNLEDAKWGDIWDQAVKARPAKELKARAKETDQSILKAPDDEPVWTLNQFLGGGTTSSANSAITNYLSHVGDYLRQNVKPEDLSKYDLVRAVQETARNDARVAKQMEKAQSESTKYLPVHKEYPDGFKWVELKLPEKLTPEQAKQVRPATKQELTQAAHSDRDFMGGEDEVAKLKGYVAVGPDGKAITNSYTGDRAMAPTPEEAWLAGRLAEEGNQMGHCVGGYCPSVASGESRIFSLRDEKGRSHVTVEVAPNPRLKEHFRNATPEERAAAEAASVPDIIQIKGKQNRAPNKEYLPYVQDFVRSGKWGEVGDLENTGLYPFRQPGGTTYPREWVQRDSHGDIIQNPLLSVPPEDLDLKPGYYTESELREAAQKAHNKNLDFRFEPPKGQRGFVDQNVVVGLAGLGLGAIVGTALSDDPSGTLLGALAGAALGLPGIRARIGAVVKAADYGLGSLSTRIGNISPALKMRGREYERRVLQQSYDTLHKVVPFMKELNKLPDARRQELERAILTNDPKKIADLMQGNAALVAGWRETRNVLHDLGAKLQGHGRFKTMLDDYFPRLVKDVEGLKAALGTPERTRLEQALLDGDKAAIKARGTPMTMVEKSALINREVQGFRRAKGYQPGFAKGRGVDEITEKLQPFYHTASESLYAYVRGAIQDLELARFFGRDLVQTEKGATKYTNIEASVGNVVGRELSEGKITQAQAQELIGMLQSRFQGGERSPNKLVQEVRNLGNMGLLGNVVSAATQLSDTATALYAQDLRSTITSIARQISGKEKITARDFGLADHVAEEFVSTTSTADWLNKLFKYSGFSAIDRFGKTTQLNAAHARAERLARTTGGIKQLQSEYGAMFGNEFPAFIQDLKSGQLTERVRAYMFSELSDLQPVSKSEMPQAYLDYPNGRLVYMLKTFMLKQMDIIRRDTYNEIKRGNVAKGIKNLVEYGLVLGIAGATTQMIQDWLMGRQVSFGAYDVMEQMLRTFGWGQYVRDKVAKGHPLEAIFGMAVPPYKMIDDIIRRDPRAVQYIPIIGKLFYAWELGGKEAAEISRKRGTHEDLSEEAKDYLRERRDRARARREQ